MRSGIRVAAVVGILSTFISVAHADLLGVSNQLGKPDIMSGGLNITYNATTDVFSAVGFAETYEFPAGTTNNITGANDYELTANVDASGVQHGGTLVIKGTVLGNVSPLLTGSLTGFGFQNAPGGRYFDFLFSVTGGSLASAFGGINSLVGVYMDLGNPGVFNGTFASNFQNDGFSGTADTAVIVPAPSSVTLGLLGALVTVLARRRAPLAAIAAH